MSMFSGGVGTLLTSPSDSLFSSVSWIQDGRERSANYYCATCCNSNKVPNRQKRAEWNWRRWRAQYGESTLSKTQVKFWNKELRRARDAVQNTSHRRRPRTSITPENIAVVRDLIEDNHRLTVVEICQELGMHIRYGSVQSIISSQVMATVFFGDFKGFMLIDFLQACRTVNAAYYCNLLEKVRAAYQLKRRGFPIWDVLLLHDNARSHSAALTQEKLADVVDCLRTPALRPGLLPLPHVWTP